MTTVNDWLGSNDVEEDDHVLLERSRIYVTIGLDDYDVPYFDVTNYNINGECYLFGVNGLLDHVIANKAANYWTPAKLQEIVNDRDEFLPAVLRRHRAEQAERREFEKLRI